MIDLTLSRRPRYMGIQGKVGGWHGRMAFPESYAAFQWDSIFFFLDQTSSTCRVILSFFFYHSALVVVGVIIIMTAANINGSSAQIMEKYYGSHGWDACGMAYVKLLKIHQLEELSDRRL